MRGLSDRAPRVRAEAGARHVRKLRRPRRGRAAAGEAGRREEANDGRRDGERRQDDQDPPGQERHRHAAVRTARCFAGLGLRRIRHAVERHDTPAVRGMVTQDRAPGGSRRGEGVMKLHELSPAKGSTQAASGSAAVPAPASARPPAAARRGRSRAPASSMRPGFEGGQMPLVRRVPKRGFTNIFRSRVRGGEPGSQLAELGGGGHARAAARERASCAAASRSRCWETAR